MIGFLETIASLVLVLAILVPVHELGHFLVAKACGIGVPVFSFGLGPRLFGFRRKGTDYRVSAVPLGGYVRLAGDESFEERTGTPEELTSHPRWQRFLVFASGAIFNIILAILLTWLVLSVYGRDEAIVSTAYPRVTDVRDQSTAAAAGIRVGDRVVSISGRDARDPQVEFDEILMSPGTRKPVIVERDGARLTVDLETGSDPRLHLGYPGWLLGEDNPGPPVIDMVAGGSPAGAAGLRSGDTILGAEDREPIDEIHLRALLAASAGRKVPLKVGREGKVLSLEVSPRLEGGRGIIGVSFRPGNVVHRTYGFLEAGAESMGINIELSKTLFKTLRKLVRREISIRAFSGPIEIARFSREAVKGLESFLAFLSFISLQLGILNLLPIPVLDGGHILILAVEGLIRRDLSDRLKERVIQTGMVLLLVFFGFVIYFDVIKTFFST